MQDVKSLNLVPMVVEQTARGERPTTSIRAAQGTGCFSGGPG